MNSLSINTLSLLIISFLGVFAEIEAQDEPSKLDLATAEYKLKGVKRSAKIANGAPFSLGKDGTIALENGPAFENDCSLLRTAFWRGLD